MEFTSSVEDLDAVTKKIHISVPAEEVTNQFASVLRQVSGAVNMKGFRPGKAPPTLVKKLHADRLKQEVRDRLVSEALHKIVQDKDFATVGYPTIEGADAEEGKSLEVTATLYLYPKPEPKNYAGIDLSVDIVKVEDSDVDAAIEKLRESKASLKRIELRSTAQKGDVVDLTVVATVEGEEKSSPEPLVARLGEGELLPELDEGLLGQEVGTQRSITVRFPKEHRDARLRGKDAALNVTLNALFDKVLPEMGDDFAANAGLDVKSLLELRLKVRGTLEEDAKRAAHSRAEAAVLDALVDKNPFAVPQVLVDDEIRSLIARSGVVDPRKIDMNRISLDPFRESLQEIAAKRVRGAILVDRIAEKESLTVSEEELNARLEEIASQSGATVQQVKEVLSREGRLAGVRMDILRSKSLHFLLDKASVSYVSVSKEELQAKAETQRSAAKEG